MYVLSEMWHKPDVNSLMPILWIMYILNYVDRTNIGNAKIAGMSTDLALDDQRYALALSIFFVGYLLMEVPSNMILSRSRPSIFLPAIMLVWGALSGKISVLHTSTIILTSLAAMGATPTYGGLIAFRFVLGCIESGFLYVSRGTVFIHVADIPQSRCIVLAQLLVQASRDRKEILYLL